MPCVKKVELPSKIRLSKFLKTAAKNLEADQTLAPEPQHVPWVRLFQETARVARQETAAVAGQQSARGPCFDGAPGATESFERFDHFQIS
jgi:hypothetical protein